VGKPIKSGFTWTLVSYSGGMHETDCFGEDWFYHVTGRGNLEAGEEVVYNPQPPSTLRPILVCKSLWDGSSAGGNIMLAVLVKANRDVTLDLVQPDGVVRPGIYYGKVKGNRVYRSGASVHWYIVPPSHALYPKGYGRDPIMGGLWWPTFRNDTGRIIRSVFAEIRICTGRIQAQKTYLPEEYWNFGEWDLGPWI
jgi:hypothetical protein